MANLYLITGSDDFAVKSKAREIVEGLCGEIPEENQELEIIRGDSDEMKPDAILDAFYNSLNTPPFLCSSKKIWLKNFQHFEKVLESAGKKGQKSRIDDITEYLKGGLPDDTIVIINGPGIDKRKAFFKTCQSTGEVFSYEKASIKPSDYAVRIRQICTDAGKNIDQRALMYLVDTVGSDTARLHSELEKLFCYAGDNPHISIEDCKNICSRTPEAMSWDFANALTSRNIPQALDVINTLMIQLRGERGGSNLELNILFQAIKSFQDMVKTRCAAAELGINGRCNKSFFDNPNLKRDYPNNFLTSLHPFRAYNLCGEMAAFPDKKLVRSLNALLEANRKLVSGGGDSRIVLEQLVIDIAGK